MSEYSKDFLNAAVEFGIAVRDIVALGEHDGKTTVETADGVVYIHDPWETETRSGRLKVLSTHGERTDTLAIPTYGDDEPDTEPDNSDPGSAVLVEFADDGTPAATIPDAATVNDVVEYAESILAEFDADTAGVVLDALHLAEVHGKNRRTLVEFLTAELDKLNEGNDEE